METAKTKLAKFDAEKEYTISFSDKILVNQKNVFGNFQFKEVEGIIPIVFALKLKTK